MNKTLILPTDDAAYALKLFRQYLYDEPYALVVVLGATEVHEATVARAGKLAGKPDDPRYVVWIRRLPKDVAAEIAGLDGAAQHILAKGKLRAGVLAFAVSLANKVTDAIDVGAEAPDYWRLTELWNSTVLPTAGGQP